MNCGCRKQNLGSDKCCVRAYEPLGDTVFVVDAAGNEGGEGGKGRDDNNDNVVAT